MKPSRFTSRALSTRRLLAAGSAFLVGSSGWFATASAQCPTPTFQPTIRSLITPRGPQSMALGPMTGDLLLDLVTVHSIESTVSIFPGVLGENAYSFGDPVSASVGANPRKVVVGQMNNDGLLDIVTASAGNLTVSVRLGTGQGTFGSPTSYAAGGTPASIALGDLNNDGRTDIVAANAANKTVSVLLALAAGGFAAPTTYLTSKAPQSVAIGDFNSNGNPDVVVAGYDSAQTPGTVTILLGNGLGAIGKPVSVAVDPQPMDIAATDLNNDGQLDVVTANASAGTISVLLGQGNGTFHSMASYAAQAGTAALAVGDLNRDGKTDIAAANYTAKSVSIWLGAAGGVFGAPTHLSAPSEASLLAMGDLNGDSVPDLVVGHRNTGYVSILLNNCQETVCQQSCAALDTCHLVGVCDPITAACTNPPKADGANCDDYNACTMQDTCQSGICAGGAPKVCAAKDACHLPGVCDPEDGVCSEPIKPNGQACDDGNGCTVADTCQGGVCSAGSPKACVAQDQCHSAGQCNPASGQCSNPTVPNGVSCNDANACTQVDTCQAGVCSGGSPKSCAALDQCHVAGQCDPGTGACSNPPKQNGSACNDSNLCTQVDSCQAGACAGASPKVCVSLDECHNAGVCAQATGVCSNPQKPDGSPCTDGACHAGVCEKSILNVRALDAEGLPIQGASVTLGAAQYVTDSDGRVQIGGLPPGRVVAQVSASGYAESTAVATLQPGEPSEEILHLLRRGEPIPMLGSTGGDIFKGKVHIHFDPNSIVNNNNVVVTGVVGVSVAPLDPTTADIAAMPGPLEAVIDANGATAPIASVFMGEVKLWSGGQEMKLKNGSTATVEFELPDALQGVIAENTTIDAWYFNPADGFWYQDGTGTVVPSSAHPQRLAWKKQVSHFTWWNADFWIPWPQYGCANVFVTDGINPIGNVVVKAITETGGYDSILVTSEQANPEGFACINVLKNIPTRFAPNDSAYGNAGGPASTPIETITLGSWGTCAINPNACQPVTLTLAKTTCMAGSVQSAASVPIDVVASYDTGFGAASVKPDTSLVTDNTGLASYCLALPVQTDVTVSAVRTIAPGEYLSDEKNIVTQGIALECSTNMCTPVDTLVPTNAGGGSVTWEAGLYGDDTNFATTGIQAAVDISYDPAGNAFIVGSFDNRLRLPAAVGPDIILEATLAVNKDVFLAKLDGQGQALWAKRFGDAATQTATALVVDPANGEVVIVGTNEGTVSFGATGTYASHATGGYIDGFIARFASDGTCLWSIGISGAGAQRPQDVAIDPVNHAIMVTGYFDTAFGSLCQSTDGCFLCKGTGCPSGGVDDIFAVYCYQAGNNCYVNTYGGAGNQRAYGVTADAAGNWILTGEFEQSLSLGGASVTATNQYDAFVGKLPNLSNVPLWLKRYGDLLDQRGVAIATDAANNIFVAGNFQSSILFGETPSPENPVLTSNGAATRDIFLAKIDPDGKSNPVVGGTPGGWSKRFGDASDQKMNDVAIDIAGNVIVTGSFTSSVCFDQTNNCVIAPVVQGQEDIFVAKFKGNDGTYLWARTDGYPGVNYFATNPGIGADFGPTAIGRVLLTTSVGAAPGVQPKINFTGSPMSGVAKTDFAVVELRP